MKRITNSILAIFLTIFIVGCSDDDDDPTPVVEEVVTIVDAAVANGDFTTLVAALQATGLDSTLADENGDFTVFAPTDAAFEALGQDTIDALLDDTDTLASILTYHVLSGSVDSSSAISLAGTTVETVNGASVGLSLDGSDLLVNTSTVLITDIATDNGIIHVIDAVLMPPASDSMSDMNIVETAVANGNFTTLVTALQEAGLDSVLADETSTFTVFAPTDAAFAAIDANLLDGILDDPETLSAILLQHVISGAAVDSVTAFSLNGQNATTASEAMIPVSINSTSDMLLFGGANIVTKDIYTSNGIIHVIDMVVVADVDLPDPLLTVKDVAMENGNFNTLIAALEATGLDTVLDDRNATFTVFAPTDDAFALLGEDTINNLLADTEALSNILLYHVVSDAEVLQDAAVTLAQSDMNKVTMANDKMTALSYLDSSLFINQSLVSTPNVMADNGVIHVVDQVILPMTETDSTSMNIAELALATDDLSTLVTALQTANLVDALADETETFTVFAPTNSAFDKIPDTTLDALLADNESLTSVLLQHVVSGSQLSSIDAFAANGKSVDTIANDDIDIRLINNAQFSVQSADEIEYHKASEMLIGGPNSSKPGMTLYVFNNDLGSSSSNCVDACATNWPPVLTSDNSLPDFYGISTIDRSDGTKQLTYLGRPLYFYVNDMAEGEMKGDGINDVWWTVKVPQIQLNVQGANVTVTDIKAANGTVHLIDTVITETLD
jgi:uncharacterized surface protein with fasciclin (FAS1) repeats